MGITEVVLWLPLDFSLSKAADSTATGAGVLGPSRPQAASADRAGPASGAGNSKTEPTFPAAGSQEPVRKLASISDDFPRLPRNAPLTFSHRDDEQRPARHRASTSRSCAW